jgi:hypothetical protein
VAADWQAQFGAKARVTKPLARALHRGERPTMRRPLPKKIGEHDHELRASKGRWPGGKLSVHPVPFGLGIWVPRERSGRPDLA